MEIKDLAGLSKPLCKLIDVFQNGCSWALKPTQIKRIASASSEVLSLEANADFKKHLKEALLEDTINATHSIREKRQLNNIASIYANAAQELQMIDNIDSTAVDPDWAAAFFDYSKDISDEEAQFVWAKILSGEIVKPGSFYKRTLSVLKNIETVEAKWFVSMCKFVFCDSFMQSALFRKYFPYNQMQSLIDCGLMNNDNCELRLYKGITMLNGKTFSLKIKNSQTDDLQMSINVYSLTDAGIQLYKITKAQTDNAYMLELKGNIEQRYNLDIELIQISQ